MTIRAVDVHHAEGRRQPVRGGRMYPAEARQTSPREGGQPPIFEVLDDGARVPIERVRFLGAAAYGGDTTLAPIRTRDDEEREASRDDVRVYAIFLDDYHVERLGERRVIDPLIAFVQRLPPTDLVAVYHPLDSMTDVHFARDREPVL